MSLQASTTVRNAILDAIETAIGASAVLQIRTGSPPATCATANSGTLLAQLTLPADWMAAAASGSKALSGTWEDSSSNASGTIGHWRIFDSTATTCHLQGTAGTSGTDMIVSTASTTSGDPFTVTAFTLSAANA